MHPNDGRISESLAIISMPVDIWGSERERRSLHFFRSRTVPQLSGCFGSEFWDRLILQAASYEPAFRHAVIAVGFAHELFECNGGRVRGAGEESSEDYFAIKQYNIAIMHLLTPFSRGHRQAVDIFLASCVLFTCFEVSYQFLTAITTF